MNPVLKVTLLSSCVLPFLWLTALPASAGSEGEDDACAALCQSLDAIEEDCEAQYGDGDVFCEAIGAVEETCDPEDADDDDDDDATTTTTTTPDEGGADADCADLCAGIDGADDLCDDHLGPANAICRALDDLSADCADDGNNNGGDDDDDGVCPGDDDDHGAGGGHDQGHNKDAKGKNRKDGGHMMCATGPASPMTGFLLGSLLAIGLRRRQS